MTFVSLVLIWFFKDYNFRSLDEVDVRKIVKPKLTEICQTLQKQYQVTLKWMSRLKYSSSRRDSTRSMSSGNCTVRWRNFSKFH